MSEISDSLLNGRWQWILNIERYQNRHTIDALSVADHSWLTAMLGLMIYDSIDFNMDTEWTYMERGEVVIKALLHDVEESMTGDIPLEAETRIAMKHAKELVSGVILNKIFPSDLVGTYLDTHKKVKDNSVSGVIIKYADMLSALIEALREKQLGSTNFDDVIGRAIGHLHDIVTGIAVNTRNDDTLVEKVAHFLFELTDDIIGHVNMTYSIES